MTTGTGRSVAGWGTPASRAREFSFFAASTVLYQGARFLFSLAAARSLAAADFAAWMLVVALLAYAPALLIGVNNGMSRELPILIGRGAKADADRSIAATWFATVFAGSAIVGAGAVLEVAAPRTAPGSLLVSVLMAGTIVFGIQQFILRSRLRFGIASAQQGLFGALVVMTGAVLAMGGPSDFSTVVVLYGGPLVVTILFGLASAGPPMPPAWDAGETRRLAVVGVPIMLAGLVFSVFVTMDRWMAIALLGFERAAPYALASLIATAMLVVPTVVSQQTYPRMAIARGRGASSEELFAMAHHQGLIAASIVAPIGVALVVFGWLGIPALLPAYIDAGPAVVVLSFGFVTLAFMTGYGNYLNVVGAQWQYLGAQVTAAGIAVIFILVGGLTLGLTGIAVGMAASHAIYGVLLRTVAGRFLRASELPQPRRSQAAE